MPPWQLPISEQTATVNVTATDDGSFRVTNLQPGTYTVAVTVSGFETYKQEKVVVEVGQVNIDRYSTRRRRRKRNGWSYGRSTGYQHQRQR